MLNAFSDLLCSKLFWHNRLVPSYSSNLISINPAIANAIIFVRLRILKTQINAI